MLTKEMVWQLIGHNALLLKPNEVATVLNISTQTLYNQKSKGTLCLPTTKVGNQWRIRVEALVEFIAAQESSPQYEIQSETDNATPTPKKQKSAYKADKKWYS